MRWRDLRRSRNVEDRRSSGGGRISLPGGRGGRIGGFGLVVIIVLALFFGVDPSQFLQGEFGDDTVTTQTDNGTPADDEAGQFVAAVLGSTEDVWTAAFQQSNSTYRAPKLVLFSGRDQSACGVAQSAMGPFYCPADQTVYIDLSFYAELRRMGAAGDFAQAYVIAHEVGHHVQTLIGIADEVHQTRQRVSTAEANDLSVRMELQADCLSGIWARHADQTFNIVEEGDIEEALTAASAIGDDRLQRESQGYVVPESFTHGTSAQRVRWFRRGWDGGNLSDCDTFAASQL
jgi:hypothetical protein